MIPIPLDRPNLPKGASVDGVPMATTADLLALRREIDRFVVNSTSLRLFGVSAEEIAAGGGAASVLDRLAMTEAKIRLDDAAVSALASAEGLALPDAAGFTFKDGSDAGLRTAIVNSWLTMAPARVTSEWSIRNSVNASILLKTRYEHVLTMAGTGFNCRDGWNITSRRIVTAAGAKVPIQRQVMFEGQANLKIKDGKSIVVTSASYSAWAESSDVSKFVTEDGLCTVPPVVIEPVVGQPDVGQWPATNYGYVPGGPGAPVFLGGGSLDLLPAGGFKAAWSTEPKHKVGAGEPGARMAAILRAMFAPHGIDNTYFPMHRRFCRTRTNGEELPNPADAYKGAMAILQRTPCITLSILSVR